MKNLSGPLFLILIFFLLSIWGAVEYKNTISELGYSSPVSMPNSSVAPKFHLPDGGDTFQIAQASESWPKILQATIDPIKVRLGETQFLEIQAQSTSKIISVEAHIQTDNGVLILPLELIERTPPEAMLPVRYVVSNDNKLVILDKPVPFFANERSSPWWVLKVRADEEPPVYTFHGNWVVHDTHDADYITTFVVRDILGREARVELAWSDPCGDNVYFGGGNITISSSCNPGNVKTGADNGNATFSGGTYTLTNEFIVNSGNSITLSGGTISIGSGGSIVFSLLYQTDDDGDTYAPNNTNYTANHATRERRYTITGSASGTLDCYDTNSNAKPGQTTYFTGNRGDGSFDYNCDSTETKNSTTITTYTCGTGCTPSTCNSGGTTNGWEFAPVPNCGTSKFWVTGCPISGGGGCGGGDVNCAGNGGSNITQSCI